MDKNTTIIEDLHEYQRLIQQAMITKIIPEMLEFLFPDGKKQTDIKTALKLCDKWGDDYGVQICPDDVREVIRKGLYTDADEEGTNE